MFDEGNGPPLIVIPGIQGRWEWLTPTLRALSHRCRTISYTLAGDLGSDSRYDPELGFENYVRQLDGIFEKSGIERAALCGISYGGIIALRYAATRPRRVSALVIASSPAPGWVPTRQQRRYVSRPWLSAPAFVATSPARLYAEIHSAFDTWPGRIAFGLTHAARALRYPMIPSRMAERVVLQQRLDFNPDCASVQAPALVVTGEDRLDRIVPVAVTRRYLGLIRDAQHVEMSRTGHLGVLTQPERFAGIVGDFVANPTRARTRSA